MSVSEIYFLLVVNRPFTNSVVDVVIMISRRDKVERRFLDDMKHSKCIRNLRFIRIKVISTFVWEYI